MHKILLSINVSFSAAWIFAKKKMYGLNCVTRVMQSDEQHLAYEP